ncbi:MAG TPA: hypothetical protein VML55_05410 [Planctomycetaceae bacterium]|nr:hypothetical protein [Planctomycetaceae bacterium]
MISTRRIPNFFMGANLTAGRRAIGWLVLLAVARPIVAAGDQPRAITAGGTAVAGRLAGESPPQLAWTAEDGRSYPADELRRIDFPPAAAIVPGTGPLRQFMLRGGDRISGVLVGLDEQQAILGLRAIGRLTLPRSALTGFRTIPRLRDVVYEDFEHETMEFSILAGRPRIESITDGDGDGNRTRALRLGLAARLEYAPASPIENGRVQLRFRLPQPAGPPETRCGVELVFMSDSRSVPLRIRLPGGNRQAFVEAPGDLRLAAQALPVGEGWRRLAISVRDRRLTVLIDEHVLASGQAPAGRLTALRLFSEPVATGRSRETDDALDGGPLIDDVLIQEYRSTPAAGLRRAVASSIEFDSGDRLYGTIASAGAHSVEIVGAYGTVRRSWSEISRIVLDGASATPPASISGLWARVTLPAPIECPDAPHDTLELALQSVAHGILAARHPILGEIRLELTQVRRIEPQFIGTRLPLSLDVHHLGDEARADFRQPVPAGHTLRGEFTLESVPSGEAFFAVDAADLEPSGPQTPLGSPYLRELRAGHLRTGVIVNGQRLGSLNDHIRWKAPIDRPERLRVPIPAGALKPGRNVWTIEQLPARNDPREFDDAEFGPIAIEFDGRQREQVTREGRNAGGPRSRLR